MRKIRPIPIKELHFLGCIINGVDEKMILFSQYHFFCKKN